MREMCQSFNWKEREREKSGQQGGHGTNDDLPKSKVLFAGTSSLGGIVRWMTKRAGSRSTPVFLFFLRLHAMMMMMMMIQTRDHI